MGGARGRWPRGGRAGDGGGDGTAGPGGRRGARAPGCHDSPAPGRAARERAGRGAHGGHGPARVARSRDSVAGLSVDARGAPRHGPARDRDAGRRRGAPPRRPRDSAGAGAPHSTPAPGLRPRRGRRRGPRAPGLIRRTPRRARHDAHLLPDRGGGGALAARVGDASGGRADRRARAAWGDEDGESG